MRARVLVLPAAALLVAGVMLRHSLAIPDDAGAAPGAGRESPHVMPPASHASAPTPRPELPADDVSDGDNVAIVEEPEAPADCPEGCPLDNREQLEQLPPVAPNTIHGHLTDTRGMPVAGAVVTAMLTGTRISRVYTTTSGDSGYYALPDLQLGSYTVTYAVDGQTQRFDLQIDGATEVVSEPVFTPNGDWDISEEPNQDEPVLSVNKKQAVHIDYEYEL